MTVKTTEFSVPTRGETDVVDVTARVERAVADSGVTEGQVLVFVAGSTAALTTVEYEPGLVKDLQEAFERLAARDARYHHEEAWRDGNGYAHVRASLLGQDLTFPVVDGKLRRGTWQQAVLIDFDNRPRKRELVVQVTGR